jgi:hypothetical protein
MKWLPAAALIILTGKIVSGTVSTGREQRILPEKSNNERSLVL